MSMIGHLLLVDDADVTRLLDAPEGIDSLLAARVRDVRDAKDHVCLEKDWHALHFLFTKTAWVGSAPLNFVATGGTPIGEEDVGYGPARALRASEVAFLATALEGVTAETLLARYDGARMDEEQVYPLAGSWGAQARAHAQYGRLFEAVRALLKKGAATRRGMLVWID